MGQGREQEYLLSCQRSMGERDLGDTEVSLGRKRHCLGTGLVDLLLR